MCENTVMAFPIENRISTKLFIDRSATLIYIADSRIAVVTNEGDQRVCFCCLEDQVYLV